MYLDVPQSSIGRHLLDAAERGDWLAWWQGIQSEPLEKHGAHREPSGRAIPSDHTDTKTSGWPHLLRSLRLSSHGASVALTEEKMRLYPGTLFRAKPALLENERPSYSSSYLANHPLSGVRSGQWGVPGVAPTIFFLKNEGKIALGEEITTSISWQRCS